ncbi:MAG TPA: PspC domain-containing protein [Candidatus Paceibacterota bacterium]|nr:PspC domain-containing protein [Candidatus Paceibacterota bacterium]HPT40249.1 PspC domain-containing protein [Candidatus Paceibacterota bacterium]
MKKLYRSRENKVFCGLVGGLGEYFDVDPKILRVAWITISILSAFFPGVLAYIFSCLVVPMAPKKEEKQG